MIVTRRFVLLFALMIWQGGFMFYGIVTVRVMRHVLEGRPEPGLITQQVTQWMNLIGTIAIVAMFADLWASPLTNKRWRYITWFAMALPHPLLIWLHLQMSSQMKTPEFHTSGMNSFMAYWHRPYLLINSVQWLGGMSFAVLSLRAWRAEELNSTSASPSPAR